MANISEFVDKAHTFLSVSLPWYLPWKIAKEDASIEDLEVDRISELPDSICQEILGRLPITDARLTSFLSRRWRFMWQSSTSFNFDEDAFYRKGYKSFHKFVNGTLQLHQNNSTIEFLYLHMVSLDNDNAQVIENSIAFAVERNAKDLHLITEYTPKESLQPVLTCKLITILKLGECSIKSPDSIDMPALRTLALANVVMFNGVLEEFISRCPSIENLCLQYIWSVSSFNICSHNLKCILLESFYMLQTTKIDAPNLEFLYYMNDRFPTELQIASCTRLKFLHLHYAESLQNHALENLIVLNPHLEWLELTTCPTLQHTSIRSQSLRHLILRNCRNLVDLNIDTTQLESIYLTSHQKILEVKIDAPHLNKLSYAGNLITFSKINSPHLMETEIFLDHSNGDAVWYIQLKKVLEKCECSYMLRLKCWEDKDLVIPKEMRESLLPQLCRLQHLKVRVSNSTMSHSELEEGLHWIFPSLSTLEIEIGYPDQTSYKYERNTKESVATPSMWRSIGRRIDEVRRQFLERI